MKSLHRWLTALLAVLPISAGAASKKKRQPIRPIPKSIYYGVPRWIAPGGWPTGTTFFVDAKKGEFLLEPSGRTDATVTVASPTSIRVEGLGKPLELTDVFFWEQGDRWILKGLQGERILILIDAE